MANGNKLIDDVKAITDIDDRLNTLEKYGIYTSLTDLKDAEAGNLPYTLITVDGRCEYTYIAGDYTGQDDNINVIKLNSVLISVGALILQSSKTIQTSLAPGLPAFSVNKIISRRVSLDDFKTSSRTWAQSYSEALSRGYREINLEDHDYDLGTNPILVNKAGATLVGKGFRTTPNHTGVSEGTRIIYTGTGFAVRVADPTGGGAGTVIERVNLSDFSVVPGTGLDPVLRNSNGAVLVNFARHIEVSRLYFAGLQTGMKVNDQVWLSKYSNIGAFGCLTGYDWNSGAEDSELYGLIARGYSSDAVGININYQAQCVRLNTCDFSNNGIGALVNNGNISGAPLEMHVEFDNCITELDRQYQDRNGGGGIVIISGNSAIDQYPVVSVRHHRFFAYNTDKASQIMPCIRASHVKSLIVEHATEAGYDYLVYTDDVNKVGSVDIRGDVYKPRIATLGGAVSEACTHYDGPRKPTRNGPFKRLDVPADGSFVNAWNIRQLTNILSGQVSVVLKVRVNNSNKEPRSYSEWMVTWGSFTNPEVKKLTDNSDGTNFTYLLKGSGDYIQIAQATATSAALNAEISVEWIQ